jgi:hypothetical protein
MNHLGIEFLKNCDLKMQKMYFQIVGKCVFF